MADAIHRVATGEYNARALLDEDVLAMPRSRAPLDAFVDPNAFSTH